MTGFATIAEMITAVTDMVNDTNLLPIAFVVAVVSVATYFLRGSIKGVKN